MTTTSRSLVRAVGFAAMIALGLSVTACGGDSGDGLPPPASPPADTPAQTIDPEHQQILDVYYGSVDAMVAAQAAGDPDYPDLANYFLVGAAALMNVESGIQHNNLRGTYYLGDLKVVSATVTEVDLEAEPPVAVIEACLDYSNYLLVHREDDSRVPGVEPPGRHPVTNQAVLGTDGFWYIATSETHWTESC